MGLAEGGITYKTFYVEGDVPADFRQRYLERLVLFRFRPLTVEDEEDLAFGWVPINDLLSSDFRTIDVYYNEYLAAAVRIDRWAIPPALLKANVRHAEKALKEELQRTRLNRMQKGELVDRERKVLMRKTIPAVRAVDFCWNLNKGLVRFSNLGGTVSELFADLFERTFELRLVPDNPYIRATTCGLAPEQIGRLADVAPADLVGGTDGLG